MGPTADGRTDTSGFFFAVGTAPNVLASWDAEDGGTHTWETGLSAGTSAGSAFVLMWLPE